MKLIVILDDNKGMMFNGRRQSQDRTLKEYILNMIGDNKLYMTEYSEKQFKNSSLRNSPDILSKIIVTDDFSLVASNDYVLVEDTDITPYIDKITDIIICKWNKTYPSDTYFTISLDGWVKETEENIQGYSHEKITIEKWTK